MRDKLTTFLTVVVMMLILAVGITKAQGDPPETITYQGHLLDAANDPVPNDTYSMSFELYDDAAAGSSIWGPEALSVTTSSGYFSVLLGETEPITSGLLTTGTWLEVVVEGETMTPRHQFGSVPFALNASEVQEFTIGDLDCTDGQIARYYEGSGWLCVNTSTGDITAVNAGTGLSGGGDSGAVTVTLDYTETGDISSVVAGDGLSGGGETGSVTLTLDYTDTLGNLDCSTDQIAEYNGSEWQCTDPVAGTSGGGGLAIYGSGADGDVTISSNTTLTGDMYYDSLTINSGAVLETNGYIIWVKDTLTVNGEVSGDGADREDAGADNPDGRYGASAGEGSLRGGDGGNGGKQHSDDDYGGGGGAGGSTILIMARYIDGSGSVHSVGGDGGPAGDGGQTGTSNGGAGESVDIGGGEGGAGGRSGGEGGAVEWVGKHYLLLHSLRGGAGGGGGRWANASGGCGGGGGGGNIILVYDEKTGSLSLDVSGGAGGTARGDDGVDGSSGVIVEIENQ